MPVSEGNVDKNMNIDLNRELAIVEAVLFLESEPLNLEALSESAQLSKEVVQDCLELLKEKYAAENSGIELAIITGGYVLCPKKEIWEGLKERYGKKNEGRLSKAALETLSIIAYSQPVTRAEIESIRGVSADNMIRTLCDRKLVKEVGRKDIPGKPVQFGTTKDFLVFFHLDSIADLPKLDKEDDERFELAR